MNVRRLLGFLGNQVGVQLQLAEALLQICQRDTRGSLGVRPEGLLEVLDLSSGIGGHQSFPGLVGVKIRSVVRVDVVSAFALRGAVSLLLASETGGRRGSWTVRGAMAGLAADSAVSGERALDCWIGALGLVVTVKGQPESPLISQ